MRSNPPSRHPDAIRSIVISGGSGVFTAGNDLEDFAQANTSNSDDAGRWPPRSCFTALAYNEKPLIGAVDGIAVGVGTTMLFHCDYVLASTTATFSTPFIHLGLVPEAASSLLAPRVMGHQRAFSMLVMGRTVSAEEAREAGFVNVVVAPGHTEVEARKIAREIAALPTEAVADAQAAEASLRRTFCGAWTRRAPFRRTAEVRRGAQRVQRPSSPARKA